MAIPRPLTLAITGTSLTSGKFSADWVPQLLRDARSFPEVKGPIFIYNLGHGGWTSSDILAAAPILTRLKPTHILTEGGAINDCFDTGSGPSVSRATHIANIQGFLGQWLSGVPGVDITLQTMSSVSSYQTARTALGAYYGDELTTAAALGVRTLDNYPGWLNPLPGNLTSGQTPFLIPPTAGFGSLDGSAVLSDFGPNAASPDGKILMSSASTAWNGGRTASTTPVTAKTHIEFKVPSGGTAPNYQIGFGNLSASLSAALGNDINSVAVEGSAGACSISFNGAASSTSITAPAGKTVALEIDPVAKQVWFMDSVSRSAPASYAGLTGNVYPIFSMFSGAEPLVCNPTDQGDGLHPIWLGGDDTYLYPNIKAWIRARAATFWP